MIEILGPEDLFDLPEDTEPSIKDRREELRALLPLSFLAVKRMEEGNHYVFQLDYKAYPLYAFVNELDKRVTITKREPPFDWLMFQDHHTEDDIVFPYLDYQHIISKAMYVITTSPALWVPLLGASKHSKEVTGLPSGIFEEQVNEVVAISKE